MKRNLILAVAALSLTTLTGVQAQQGQRFQPRAGVPQGNMMGGGMMGGMMGMSNLRLTEPTMSSVMLILKRNDVRTELAISSRQREQIEEVERKAPEEMRQKLRQNAPDFQNLRNLPEEERKEQMAQFGEKMRNAAYSFADDLDTKVEKALRPEQAARLRELDLQWRGGLAIANPKIAEALQLSAEQKTKVEEVMQEYRKAMGEVFQNAFSDLRSNRATSANGRPNAAPNNPNSQTQGDNNRNNGGANAPTQPRQPRQMINPQEIQNRIANAAKELDKVRKTLGEKALTALQPEQLEVWKRAAGKKFAFRTND